MAKVNLPIGRDWTSTLTNWKRVLENSFGSVGTVNVTSLAATKITISDTGGYYDGTNAETVFNEVGKSVAVLSTALPAASSSYCRKLLYLSNPSKTADKIYICSKTSDDSYAWTALV